MMKKKSLDFKYPVIYTKNMDRSKPSIYLVEKCQNLKSVLDFFLSKNGGFHRTVFEKRAVFLSQIDFWDWEIDELIFAVESFEDRSKNWTSVGSLSESVSKMGIALRPGMVDDIRYKREVRAFFEDKTVAPTKALNAVIIKWNSLLRICEDSVMMDKKKLGNAINLGAQFIPDLNKYRKTEKALTSVE